MPAWHDSRYTRNSSGYEIPERDIGSYTPLAFNASDEGVPLREDQRVAKVQNGEEILLKVSTPE